MAGYTTILAQAVPCLLNAFPGWKQPTHCRLVAQGAGTSVPTLVTTGVHRTTPGFTITRSGVGQLNIIFPGGLGCRAVEDINPQVWCTDPDTAALNLGATVDGDPTLTLGTLGKFRLLVYGKDDGAAEDLEAGDFLHVCFWVDLG